MFDFGFSHPRSLLLGELGPRSTAKAHRRWQFTSDSAEVDLHSTMTRDGEPDVHIDQPEPHVCLCCGGLHTAFG